MFDDVIRRKEIKYILTLDQYNKLMERIGDKIEKDQYFKSTICNIYFDTDNDDLIIKSIEKPRYKEKIRLRSYVIPKLDTEVFLEIKKKLKGEVYKRRIKIKLKDFYKYIESGELSNEKEQITKELDYSFKYYDLKPRIYLAYDRLSYYDKDSEDFRITFDMNIRSRKDDLRLEHGDKGDLLFEDGSIIMETKTLGSYPLWFVKVLSELKIYSQSFSKYGSIYTKNLLMEVSDYV